jgi:hypothetical protein
MKKLLTVITLLTLGLTLTPARAAFDPNSLPTEINISGMNFTAGWTVNDPLGDGLPFTYSGTHENIAYYADGVDSTIGIDITTGKMRYACDLVWELNFDENGMPTDENLANYSNPGTWNLSRGWGMTDQEGNYILSANGSYCPPPSTTLEDQAASVSAGLELQDGVFVPTR